MRNLFHDPVSIVKKPCTRTVSPSPTLPVRRMHLPKSSTERPPKPPRQIGFGLIALLLIHHVDQWLSGSKPLDVLPGSAYHPRVVLIRASSHVRCNDCIIE